MNSKYYTLLLEAWLINDSFTIMASFGFSKFDEYALEMPYPHYKISMIMIIPGLTISTNMTSCLTACGTDLFMISCLLSLS